MLCLNPKIGNECDFAAIWMLCWCCWSGTGGRGRRVEADPPDQTFQSPVWGHPQPVNQWGLTTHPSRKSNLDYMYNQMVRWTLPSRPNNVCKMSVRPQKVS